MLPLFDHHVHLDDPRTPEARVRAGLDDPRLVGAVSAGYGPERSHLARQRLADDPRLARTVAPHPWWLANHDAAACEAAWQATEAELGEAGVVAVGEIGLDRTVRARMPLEVQERHMRRGLELARACDLPVVLHVVRWNGHALRVLRDQPPPGGVMHRYGGPPELLPDLHRLGLAVSLCTVRHRRAPEQVAAVVRAADPARLLVETDWPLDARPWSEALDELEALVRFVAEVRGVTPEAQAAAFIANARALYRLSDAS